MTLFSAWFVVGFVLGAIAGTLVTDLTREEVRQTAFEHTLRFWEWSRQQSLLAIALLWAALLAVTIISALSPGTTDWWKNLLVGSIIGAAAAPWVWLHFVRHFGSDGKLEPSLREALITARAYNIWCEQRQPSGRADEHYATAQRELDDVEQRAVETSAKSAEQQLARYRLVSILLGVSLLVGMLLPVLQDWLGRTQQFQAFGVSLTLISNGANQGRGTPVVGYSPRPSGDLGGDRLLGATTAAYEIGAASLEAPIALLERIGPDLKDFGNLSMINRDRAFIAWLTYELYNNGPGTSAGKTFIDYLKGAEELLQQKYEPPKWVDPTIDWDFAAGSTIISSCLHDYAAEVHDPHFFTVDVGRFLRSFSHEAHEGLLSRQLQAPLNFPGYLGSTSELPDRDFNCGVSSIRLLELDIPYKAPKSTTFGVTPYPSLIAAAYLAAIGAVDTGVLFIEDWIRHFGQSHGNFTPEYEPQLGWYLLRAKLSAVNLPYQFGGLIVPHRQLVRWQVDESDQFGRLLQVEGPDGWKRLCSKLLPNSLHNNIGQWLAFNYVTDRFYLFETLTPEDFDPRDHDVPKSLTAYLREAEAIRDNHACIERVPSFLKFRSEYTSYFRLYTAQLRLAQLVSENDPAQRKSLTETIRQELQEADHFQRTADVPTLLAPNDIWERHRVRLKLLRGQFEDRAKSESRL